MKSRLLWASYIPLIVLGAASSGRSENDQAGAQSAMAAMVTPETGTGAGETPDISARSYVGGSAKLKVAGSFQVDEDIPINTKASVSDGGMTWLQYGVSGPNAPELTVTVSSDGVGLVVGRGKQTATAGADACTGSVEVTANSIAGHYTCPGVASYDSGAGIMGKVNVELTFAAKS